MNNLLKFKKGQVSQLKTVLYGLMGFRIYTKTFKFIWILLQIHDLVRK